MLDCLHLADRVYFFLTSNIASLKLVKSFLVALYLFVRESLVKVVFSAEKRAWVLLLLSLY